MSERQVPEVTAAHIEAAHRVFDYYTGQPLAGRIALAIAYAEQRGAASAQAEAQPAGAGWVSAEERLPATAEAVLVVNNGQRGIAWHSAMGWYSYRDTLLAGVTHWAPLPPPPEPTK